MECLPHSPLTLYTSAVAQNLIKQCVEVIEQAHHLSGLTQGCDGGKARH